MRRGRAALLLAFLACLAGVLLAAGLAPAHAGAGPAPSGRVILVVLPPASFEQVMAVPQFRRLAVTGGAALMTAGSGSAATEARGLATLGAGAPVVGDSFPATMTRVAAAAGVPVCTGGPSLAPPPAEPRLRPLVGGGVAEPAACDGPRALIVEDLAGIPLTKAGAVLAAQLVRADRTLVIVLSPSPSAAMDRRGDQVTPILMAVGPESRLLGSGAMRTLTSDSTRRDGVVSNLDVAPTVLAFLGVPVPSSMDGSPIVPADAPAPFSLHRRYLEERRIRFPLDLGVIAYLSAIGLVGIAAAFALSRGWSPPRPFTPAFRLLAMATTALPIALGAGGLLPSYGYAVVIPFVILVPLALGGLALRWRRWGLSGPFAVLGAIGLAFVAGDLATGGHGLSMPLFGGTMFDGVRFYGLPNAFEALLMASGVFVAARLRPAWGGLLLAACGLLAALPGLGADLGGGVVLFAAAGLWWQLRTRGRLGVRELAVAFGTTLAGLVLALAANRFLASTPTHVTRFVERGQSHVGTALTEIGHRLSVGVHQLAAAPVSIIPLVGLPVILWAALSGPGVLGRGLRLAPGWRDVVVVIVLGSAIGYVVNDTGLAAAAPGFLYAMTSLFSPAIEPAAR